MDIPLGLARATPEPAGDVTAFAIAVNVAKAGQNSYIIS
jgi:hypothetical protein